MSLTQKSFSAASVLLVAATMLAGCSSVDVSDMPSSSVTTSTEDETSNSSTVTEPAEVTLPAGSNALGVVTAGIIIATGDISKAIESGQVTPTEVKYATLAIEEGTLDKWRERAEAEK